MRFRIQGAAQCWCWADGPPLMTGCSSAAAAGHQVRYRPAHSCGSWHSKHALDVLACQRQRSLPPASSGRMQAALQALPVLQVHQPRCAADEGPRLQHPGPSLSLVYPPAQPHRSQLLPTCSTAPFRVTSLYSLYMLWYPVRDWKRTQMPKFLMVVGCFSKISLTDRIWPLAFFTLRSFLRKYLQQRQAAGQSQSRGAAVAP